MKYSGKWRIMEMEQWDSDSLVILKCFLQINPSFSFAFISDVFRVARMKIHKFFTQLHFCLILDELKL